MRRGAEVAQIDAVQRRIAADGQPVHVFHGEERVVIAILGDALATLPGVEEVGRTTRPYKLASREVHPTDTRVRFGAATFGGNFTLGAGSTHLHEPEALVDLANEAERAGADLFWLGRPEGAELAQVLPLLADLRRKTNLPLLVEVWGPDEIDPLGTHCD